MSTSRADSSVFKAYLRRLIERFLEGFPSVKREQVIASLEESRLTLGVNPVFVR